MRPPRQKAKGLCRVLEHVDVGRAPVAQLVEHRVVMREVAGSNPGWINTQDLKITVEKVMPLELHLQMVRLSSLLG